MTAIVQDRISAPEPQPTSSRTATIVLVVYVLLNALLLMSGQWAAIGRKVFVLTSLLTGVFLYRTRGPMYAGFTLWIWFLAPFVRRIADYQAGWDNPSIVLLTPYLVTLISACSLFQISCSVKLVLKPIGLIATGILSGVIVGLFRASPGDVALGATGWVVPIVFGCYLIFNYKQYQEYRRAIIRTVLTAGIVMALYGIFQFLTAPPWDCYWIENVSPDIVDPSFGQPVPYGIRVFSTLNAPGVLGSALAMTVLLLLSRGIVWLTVPVVVALMFSQARTQWGALAAGLVALFVLARGKLSATLRRRVLVLASILVVVALILLTVPVLGDIVGDRFHTFNELGKDDSFTGRLFAYKYLLQYAAENPLGEGLTQRQAYQDLALDGVLHQMLVNMGWPGTILFLVGIGTLLCLLMRVPADERSDTTVMRAISFAMVSMAPTAEVFHGPLGMLTWTSLSLAMAALVAAERKEPLPPMRYFDASRRAHVQTVQ